MRKKIGLIAIIFVTTIVLVACNDSENNDTANNNENSVDNKTENENIVMEDENDTDDNETNQENEEGGDLDAYGEHDIKEQLANLSYEEEVDNVKVEVSDIYIGEIDVSEESSVMFEDDKVDTRGLTIKITNNNDEPITYHNSDITFVTTDKKPGLESDPLVSDPIDEDLSLEPGESQEATLWFLEDGHTEDMDDFTLKLQHILIDDETEADNIEMDITIED